MKKIGFMGMAVLLLGLAAACGSRGPSTKEVSMSETMNTIARRRAVRSYQPKQITEAELTAVLNAGSASPIGLGERDYYRLTVIQNPGMLRRITDATAKAFNHNPLMSRATYDAPTLVVVSTIRDRHPEMPGLEIASAACIADTMLIAATDLGLGSVYICAFVEGILSDPRLLADLGLPPGFTPVAGVLLGYPAEPLGPARLLEPVLAVNRIQ
ncbi:nitroreductase family protein [Breznakiella homolactica]|uniref:Nitroreductase family protein n=1 Tax=Breznakiella homolactica TaxID=2798577 RepID=A0A7T7XJQ7_9SPIR|nr:nitroreductase family protein [Breznakiella homolactica]QQO07674.1 nitroreductase family protein [Breznakiella homolactica]